ncbi:MAG: hypothetical protein JWP87_6294 [Labilithrix sp.]|jgi:hypothetical protein|nr:hypothetical protein [Labilithrix sp.]
MTSARLAPLLAGILLATACVATSGDARVAVQPPDRGSFPAVADLLDRRCGTLDCHGVTYRNLRIYGREGLRLASTDRPSSRPGTTTDAEYDATFESLVALEPETMSAVVSQAGAQPERLTFVRKARGAEDHKGLAIWAEGSPEDLCVTSWLAGKTDVATCQRALTTR